MLQEVTIYRAEATDTDYAEPVQFTASHVDRDEAVRLLSDQIVENVYSGHVTENTPLGILGIWTSEDDSRHWIVLPVTAFIPVNSDAEALAQRVFDLMSTELQDMAYSYDDWELAVAEKECYTLACKVLGQEPDLTQFLANADWSGYNDHIGSQDVDSDPHEGDKDEPYTDADSLKDALDFAEFVDNKALPDSVNKGDQQIYLQNLRTLRSWGYELYRIDGTLTIRSVAGAGHTVIAYGKVGDEWNIVLEALSKLKKMTQIGDV